MLYSIFHNSPMKTPEPSDSIAGVQTTLKTCISGSLRFSRLAQKLVSLWISLQLFLMCSDEVSNCSTYAPINFAWCKSHTQKVAARYCTYPLSTLYVTRKLIDRPLKHEAQRRMLHANLHNTSPDGGSERLCFKLLVVLNLVARVHHLLFELPVVRVLS